MKSIKRVLAFVLAAVMVLSMSLAAFAAVQNKALSPADGDNATITINNPAKGQKYTLYQLFDATVGENGEIAYQLPAGMTDIPDGLTYFFEKDSVNYVHPKDVILEKDSTGKVIGTKMTDDLKSALETWANSAQKLIEETSDGSEKLKFTGLPYGYYVVLTDHVDEEAGVALITVDSTKPNADIFDKNTNNPGVVSKETDKGSYSIGDTITYTATFDTTNYMATESNGEMVYAQVVKYEISDTLPEFLSDVEITEVKVGETALDPVPSFSNKKFEITWAEQDNDGNWTSKYAQGAQIVVTYTAKLTSVVNINTGNTNTISIRPYTVNPDGGDPLPWDEEWHNSNEIKTYAAALKKVDEDGGALKGAKFTAKGLVVDGEAGIYTVVSYTTPSDAQSAEMDTDDNGMLYIIGLGEDVKLVVTETKAPNGYNKLTQPVELTPQLLEQAIYTKDGTIHYDADGNVTSREVTGGTTVTVKKNLDELDEEALEVENKKGVELPATGGTGTTLFYIIGSILVIGAGIVLVAKRRMSVR